MHDIKPETIQDSVAYKKHKFLWRTIGPINKIETFDKLEKLLYRITLMYLYIHIHIYYTQTHTPYTHISYNLVRGYLTILRQMVLVIHSLVFPPTSCLPREWNSHHRGWIIPRKILWMPMYMQLDHKHVKWLGHWNLRWDLMSLLGGDFPSN